MKITKSEFGNLITTLHYEGLTQAVAEWPEVAGHAEALAQLEQAEQERARLEELETEASDLVDHIELELIQLLVEEA